VQVQLTPAAFELEGTISMRSMKGKKQTVDPADPATAHDGPDLRTRGWHRRFGQQFVVLLYKNGLVASRNWQATAARAIIAPFIFISLIWVVNEALTTGNNVFDPNRSIANPKPERVASIPDCTGNIFVQTPCLDFVWAPSTDSSIEAIVTAIRNNNPGRPIPASAVRGFPSRDVANAYEAANPETVTGGLFFSRLTGGNIGFVLQSNSTARNFHGTYLDPNLEIQIPLQVAAEREITRSYFAAAPGGRTLAAADWNVNITEFAHPPVDNYSLEGTLTGPFVFAANMFAFVLVLGAVVAEREMKLRQALRTMGMLDSAFWLSWASTELILGALTALLLAGFGAMWQFDLFRRNNFGLLFFLFFLFQLAMSSLAFLLSTVVSKASTAVNLGFVVFVIGWIMQSIIQFGYPFTPDYVGDVPIVTFLFALCPWALLSKGFNDLGLAAAGTNPGLDWGQRTSYCKNLDFAQQQSTPFTPGQYVDYDCVLPLGSLLWILFAEWLLYGVLAVYLDNVLANESGVRQRPWYFLLPSYWGIGGRGRFRKAHKQGMMATTMGQQRMRQPLAGAAGPPAEDGEQDPDVTAEATEVQALAQHRTGRSGSLGGTAEADADAAQLAGLAAGAVEVFGLQKVFGPSWTRRLKPWRWCGKRKREDARVFWALKGPWFRIPRGQLFCLLGPNGAGKTTTINCLTGVLPASGGDALVFGEALSAPGGMDRIRSRMGVCPQFDILWKELTGREHLRIYGAIKGIPRRQVAAQAAALLGRVRLTEAAGVRSGAYSGGMRRRLSVAIALLGDPEVVYLDEPTTGMDPISRRFVWDIIEEAKPGRAIVLTTHSMEEADILGDRIAIMARGRLRALGSSLRLKQRFGSGYQFRVCVGAQ
jgi:ABC-type multidrug transport system ATPase subunit